jgi:putative nucleotidyltransferase with HDIG domain
MSRPRIVLSGLGPKLQGLRWETANLLRIGRQGNVDIVLEDLSVSPRHAEVLTTGRKWLVQDLSNHPRNRTRVNGTPVEHTPTPLLQGDVIQVGTLSLEVTTLEVSKDESAPPHLPARNGPAGKDAIRTTGTYVQIQAIAHQSWDQALASVALQQGQKPRQGEQLLALLRTGYHLSQTGTLDGLLGAVLADAIHALGAQRGSIVLADPHTGKLELRTVLAPGIRTPSRQSYSRTLADRCFQEGQSILCRDARFEADLQAAQSIQCGAMASLICALLRSPRKRLGILQIDRGPYQDPFGEDDFYLADAIAASMSVGIECAQLVEVQRTQFVQTVASLARAVEVRDQYTGNHTKRVTDYSLLLADELNLPPLDRYQLEVGTPLHDIGKIGIDDAILRKPGRLTESEYEYMKQHTVKGAEILQSMNSLTPIIPIVRNHHERWDGTGYPDRLTGDKIAQTARIVAVADAFDAMTSNRPYRPAMPAERAFAELLAKAGSHFDPNCVQAFLHARRKVEALLRESV